MPHTYRIGSGLCVEQCVSAVAAHDNPVMSRRREFGRARPHRQNTLGQDVSSHLPLPHRAQCPPVSRPKPPPSAYLFRSSCPDRFVRLIATPSHPQAPAGHVFAMHAEPSRRSMTANRWVPRETYLVSDAP